MTEEVSERKYHKLGKKQKNLIIVISIVFFAVIAPVIGFFYYKFSVRRPSQTADEVTYELEKGVPLTKVSEDLFREGAINSQFLFNFYIYINKLDRNIQAGVYVIPAGTSIVELVDMLQHGMNDTQITFIEGWRVEEFAREATRQLNNVDYKDFVKLADEHEGYLFPDTYMINSDIQEGELVDFLRDNFEDKTEELFNDTDLDELGLTKDEVITLASIVEREVSDPNDRPIVAGILLKRLQEDMLIGADATTQYAVAKEKFCVPASCRVIGVMCDLDPVTEQCLEDLSEEQAMEIDWWPSDITLYDLASDSPYNTRKNLGLPPTPICNPSLDSIEAVLNYQESPYYFYLHDAEGVTYFAITNEEHENNIRKYLSL